MGTFIDKIPLLSILVDRGRHIVYSAQPRLAHIAYTLASNKIIQEEVKKPLGKGIGQVKIGSIRVGALAGRGGYAFRPIRVANRAKSE